MDVYFLLKGFILGISIAAPVGPIGLLCIRRTLEYGKLSGFISGLGAASADAIYGLIAAAGLTFLTSFLIEQQVLLHYLGGAFLFYLGIKTYLKKNTSSSAIPNESSKKGLLLSYLSVLFLTLTNPITILSFIAIFAGTGVDSSQDYQAFLLVLGIFLGSASWWLSLSMIISLFRKNVISHLNIVNKLSGIVLALFGILALFGSN